MASEDYRRFGSDFFSQSGTWQVRANPFDERKGTTENGRGRKMRIDNSYLAGAKASSLWGSQETGETERKAEASVPRSWADNWHVPSPELVQLREAVHLSADIRPEVLAAVGPLVASGYYLTPESAYRTADAMIQAVDS
jgi:hypothetical protein